MEKGSINLKGRSFLTLKDFTAEEIEYFVDLAADLKAKKKAGIFENHLEHKMLLLYLKNLPQEQDAHLQ